MTVFSMLRRVGIWRLPVPAAWYAIPLRLIIGFSFLQHGYAKLVRGPEAFIKLLSYNATGAHFGQPGYETDLLYLSGLLALCLGGAGPFSVDRYLRRGE
jgi:uncharacterized membrane protein YphA (DoxX/SURF4 family)